MSRDFATASQAPSQRARVLAMGLGGLLALIGLILAVGGGWLAALGGSWYYLLAGVGLIISGGLLLRRRVAGAWVYVAVFVATVAWALWEVGLAGWPLLPRLFGPTVLLFLVLATAAQMGGRRARRTSAAGLYAAAALVAAGLLAV